MTGTQLSFADFAQAHSTVQSAPKRDAMRANFYHQAFKEHEKKNAFSFGLDLSESLFSLLWEHYESSSDECLEVAREIATRIIGKGCEPQKLHPF